MNLKYSENEEFKDIDLYLNVKNILFKKIDNLWPKNLDENNSRAWVIQHIKDGLSPNAYAKMNFKYFNDTNKQSGLQKIYSEIEIKDLLINY